MERNEAGGQWRVVFDAAVTFANRERAGEAGGGIQVQRFRLDIPGSDITDEALGELLVRHLGLLMVDSVRISGKELVREPHKGSRGVEIAVREKRLVELSHVIRDGTITYPGLPVPEIGDHLSREASREFYADGTEFQIGRIQLVGNTGTYLDTAFHRFAGGTDLSGQPLERLVDLDGIVVRAGDARAVDRVTLLPHDVAGKAVLIHTGWDRYWGTDTYGAGRHPYLTADGAGWLAEQGAALVGIDSLNIDDTTGGARPAHTILLGAGISLIEHLCGLDQLPPGGFRFHAAPPLIEGMGTFPVRAYALT